MVGIVSGVLSPLGDLLSRISDRSHSAEFAQEARQKEFPAAFARSRKLPLATLIGALLSLRGSSQQVMLDSFFGSPADHGHWQRCVSDRGFAQARDKLS